MFGGFKYHGNFHVLKGSVPLILGMDFLKSVQPCVDWKNQKVMVFVGTRKFDLPTCSIGSVDQRDDNSFAGLEVEQDNAEHALSENSENVVE